MLIRLANMVSNMGHFTQNGSVYKTKRRRTPKTKGKPDSQGKQLGHVTEAVVGQRADLVVTQITVKETTTDTYNIHAHTKAPLSTHA